jgi:colicin import membrane protein
MAGLGSVIPGLIGAGTSLATLKQKDRAAADDNRMQQQQFDYSRQQDELRRQQEAEALAYQRQQDELRRQQEAAALEYKRQQEAAALQAAKEAEDRKYTESKAAEERRLAAEAAAREYQAQLERDARQQTWERDDRLRREAAEREAAAQLAAKQEAEAQRKQAMEILTSSHNNEYQQLLGRQNEEWSSAQSAADTQAAQIAQTSAAAEADRRAALKKTQATARARLGAGGVDVKDGSGRAVLLGRQAATDAESAAQAKSDQTRRQAIQADLDNRRRVNLLAQAELADRQRMEYLNRFYG